METSGEAGRQQVDKRGVTDAHTEDKKLMEGTRLYKGTKCGQGIVIEGWDDWDEYDLEEKNTIDDEELIKQKSVQSFQRREKELINNVAMESIGAMEEHNSTNQKEGERDNRGLDKEETKEDEGTTTETSVASDEESREETDVDLQT